MCFVLLFGHLNKQFQILPKSGGISKLKKISPKKSPNQKKHPKPRCFNICLRHFSVEKSLHGLGSLASKAATHMATRSPWMASCTGCRNILTGAPVGCLAPMGKIPIGKKNNNDVLKMRKYGKIMMLMILKTENSNKHHGFLDEQLVRWNQYWEDY